MASKKTLKTGHRQCAMCKAPADTKYCSAKCKHAYHRTMDMHNSITSRLTISDRIMDLAHQRDIAMPWDKKAFSDQIQLLELELAEIHEYAREK